MNRPRHWVVTLVVAAVAGVGFASLLVWANPPGHGVGYFVTTAAMATPWALAAGILWHAWRVRTGVRLSAMDGPARLLAGAVATLFGRAPGHRMGSDGHLPVNLRHLGGGGTALVPDPPDIHLGR